MKKRQPCLSKSNSDLFEKINSVTVVGLGETGKSCLRYLKSKNLNLTAMDSRVNPPKLRQIKKDYPDLNIITGQLCEQNLIQSDLIILSPGVCINTPEIKWANQAGVPIVGDIELFAHEVSQPVISITGSNGKSTVTALCGELLKAAGNQAVVGGNIGYPALDLLSQSAQIYVLELSSFQLETTYSLNSAAAVILNVSPDHLDRYESVADYALAKKRIFNNCQNIAFNRADHQTWPDETQAAKTISFGLDEPTSNEDFGILKVSNKLWLCQGEKCLLPVDTLFLTGQHNYLNTLAALAMVYLAGAELSKVIPVLKQFKGLPHRFEHVGHWQGVEWINDSKGTNPGATLAAISGQAKEIILIIGGDSKGADFSVLKNAIKKHVKAIVLYGRDAHLFEEILPNTLPSLYANDLSQAVQIADDFSSKENMVLFSPACASFDMFDNYMQRGDAFKRTLKEHFQ